MNQQTKEAIEWVEKNINEIPVKEFDRTINGKLVIWLLDRDDGTAGSYEVSEERLGITIDKEIIWGFSSGCSCWDGWEDDDYSTPVTYKEFIVLVQIPDFKEGWEREVLNKVNELKKHFLSGETDKAKASCKSEMGGEWSSPELIQKQYDTLAEKLEELKGQMREFRRMYNLKKADCEVSK